MFRCQGHAQVQLSAGSTHGTQQSSQLWLLPQRVPERMGPGTGGQGLAGRSGRSHRGGGGAGFSHSGRVTTGMDCPTRAPPEPRRPGFSGLGQMADLGYSLSGPCRGQTDPAWPWVPGKQAPYIPLLARTAGGQGSGDTRHLAVPGLRFYPRSRWRASPSFRRCRRTPAC